MYSGVGGADCGLAAAGWPLAWQAEADEFRRTVLVKRFGAPIACSVSEVASALRDGDLDQNIDLLYAEFPDSRLDIWWPPVRKVSSFVRRWLVCEFSPSVRCESVLRGLVLDGWAFRLLHIKTTIEMDGIAPEGQDVRTRAIVLAARTPELIDAIGVAGMSAELTFFGLTTTYQALSIQWHEVSRGLRAGWTCACGITPCVCDQAARLAAVRDATSPFMSQWLAEVIDGAWHDGKNRGRTEFDGSRERLRV